MSESLRVETVASLTERVGMSRETIVREVREGSLPYVNVGGHWRFRDCDVAYWKRNQRRAGFRVIAGAAETA